MNWNQSNNNLFLLHISFWRIKHYGSGFSAPKDIHCKTLIYPVCVNLCILFWLREKTCHVTRIVISIFLWNTRWHHSRSRGETTYRFVTCLTGRNTPWTYLGKRGLFVMFVKFLSFLVAMYSSVFNTIFIWLYYWLRSFQWLPIYMISIFIDSNIFSKYVCKSCICTGFHLYTKKVKTRIA